MDPELKKIVKWAESQGFTTNVSADGYTHFFNRGGDHVAFYPKTPSRPYRRMMDLKTDLKAAGLQIPPPSRKEQRAAKRKAEEQQQQTEGEE